MLLDSNIIIAYLAGDVSVTEFVQSSMKNRVLLCTSSVSVAEVLSFPRLEPSEVTYIHDFLDTLTILPTDRLTGEIAGLYRRELNLSLPDAMIAATARQHNLPLITNDRDFQKAGDILVRIV